ncbi:hypothetical protein AB1M95_15705 [Sulfitobacter sp. LCG007]
MLGNSLSVELNSSDLDIIETALHTQQKILSVQSEAGAAEAKERLSALTQLLGRLSRQRPAAPAVIDAVSGGDIGAQTSACGGNFITRALFC